MGGGGETPKQSWNVSAKGFSLPHRQAVFLYADNTGGGGVVLFLLPHMPRIFHKEQHRLGNNTHTHTHSTVSVLEKSCGMEGRRPSSCGGVLSFMGLSFIFLKTLPAAARNPVTKQPEQVVWPSVYGHKMSKVKHVATLIDTAILSKYHHVHGTTILSKYHHVLKDRVWVAQDRSSVSQSQAACLLKCVGQYNA